MLESDAKVVAIYERLNGLLLKLPYDLSGRVFDRVFTNWRDVCFLFFKDGKFVAIHASGDGCKIYKTAEEIDTFALFGAGIISAEERDIILDKETKRKEYKKYLELKAKFEGPGKLNFKSENV